MERQATGLAQWLNETCRREGLSLRQAGAKTGLSHGTIRDIRNGVSPSPESIRKLAEAFGGDGHEKLALEDQLLVLAGYRSPRPEGHEFSQPLARLIDRLSQFNGPQLQMMTHFAEFLAEMEKK